MWIDFIYRAPRATIQRTPTAQPWITLRLFPLLYEFTQRALINAIIDDVGLTDAKVTSVPAKESLKLHTIKDKPPYDLDFNYRSAVGKLYYLAQTTRPDIMYATHQIAKFSSIPRHMAKLFST